MVEVGFLNEHQALDIYLFGLIGPVYNQQACGAEFHKFVIAIICNEIIIWLHVIEIYIHALKHRNSGKYLYEDGSDYSASRIIFGM